METDPGGIMMRRLVERYLQERGHTLRSVRALPDSLRRPLLAAAAQYAAREMNRGELIGSPASGAFEGRRARSLTATESHAARSNHATENR